MSKRILVSGATGNIGAQVIRFLSKLNTTNKINAAVRNIEKARIKFSQYPELEYVNFDFEDQSTFANAFKNIDTVFLLRPPHIADIEKYFRPLLEELNKSSVKEIVFLSVQGAELSKVIPHNKIEALIKEFDIDYIFLRPSYFMQNLTTTLYTDIKEKRKILLPAGKAVFNWIDIDNIGEAAAILLSKFENFKNKEIELTGYENENFYHIAQLIRDECQTNITYKSTNPIAFFRIKKKEGMVPGMIIVMIMLHLLPRFQKEPKISHFYEKITGKKPTSLKEFVIREKEQFL
ncbi:MAG: NmrA family NAD(P)-binding protein [Prolixibacteraceae bacterium]